MPPRASDQRLAVTLTAEELCELVRGAVAELMAAPSPSIPQEILTRTEAARLLQVSLATLDRLCRVDGLPHHRLGDCRRFIRSDLLAWLRAGSPSRRASPGPVQNQPPT